MMSMSSAVTSLTGPLCDGVSTLRQPVDAGGYEPCPGNYACPPGATACLETCSRVEDCVGGFVCQPVDAGSNRCVAPSEVAAPQTPFCAVSSVVEGRGPGAWAAALLALLGIAVGRRRR